ncbi:hypothetical protein R3P38DRAFT_2524952, partial [Favolaschia claudopus]
SWDGFPDGRIHCHFTPQQLADTSQLLIYWVANKPPWKRGSPDAASPEKEKISRFQCAGVLECSSRVCTVQIAPGADISRQVKSDCTCGFQLHHRTCKFEWSISVYRNGAVFQTSNSSLALYSLTSDTEIQASTTPVLYYKATRGSHLLPAS